MKRRSIKKLNFSKSTLKNLQSADAAHFQGGATGNTCYVSVVTCPSPWFTNGCTRASAVSTCWDGCGMQEN